MRGEWIALGIGVLLALSSILAGTPAFGQDLAAAIDTLARSKDTTARMEAAKALGASRDPRALEPLVKALGDATRDVRWAAVEALGDLGDRRATAPLLEYLAKPEPYRWARRLIAAALGALGDPRAAPALTALLEDEDPFARRAAALALIRLGHGDARPRLEQLVRDTTDETLATVRRELARAEQPPGRTATAAATPNAAAGARTVRPREWAGIRVGATGAAEIRERLGKPIQETTEFMLYGGERFASALPADSVVLNTGQGQVVESIFVFPVWGTMDRDVRKLLGPGKIMAYAEFLKSTGRTAYGAGTGTGGKLHYLPPEVITESFAEMGMLVVYDTTDARTPERLVKLLIVY